MKTTDLIFSLSISLILLGCMKDVPYAQKPASNNDFNYCFETQFRLKDEIKHRSARVCYREMRVCNHALKTVRKYGRLAKLTSITKCSIQSSVLCGGICLPPSNL